MKKLLVLLLLSFSAPTFCAQRELVDLSGPTLSNPELDELLQTKAWEIYRSRNPRKPETPAENEARAKAALARARVKKQNKPRRLTAAPTRRLGQTATASTIAAHQKKEAARKARQEKLNASKSAGKAVKIDPKKLFDAITFTKISSGQFQCKFCDKIVTAKGRNPHKKIHSEAKIKCEKCGKTFQKRTYKGHIKICGNDEISFACPHCPSILKTKSGLIIHSKIHDKIYDHICRVCDKKFTNSSSLKTHSVVHTEKRNFQCGLCSKLFTQSPSLNKHLRTVHKITDLAEIKAHSINIEKTIEAKKAAAKVMKFYTENVVAAPGIDDEEPFLGMLCPFDEIDGDAASAPAPEVDDEPFLGLLDPVE